MENKATVSLCMIVKNEEKYLKQCLESVKDIVDEIIIVDTGSTDKTVDIARNFNAKIIYYKWTNNFAEARNVSLEYATMDWILIMDGDDVFNITDHEKFINLLSNYPNDIALFNTASFAGTKDNEVIVNNMNIRLIRNNGKYRYSGAIHEQIISIDNDLDWSKVLNFDIIIYHYGYLNEVTQEKKKRNRNISILEDELKKDPENAFHLFNLGNEYFSLGDYNKALELYNSSYSKVDSPNGFLPKLILKKIETLNLLGKNSSALKTADDGLLIFPDYTDLYFQKSLIYMKQGSYTLAIHSLESCLKMGETPLHLSYFQGVGSYRSLEQLGNVYFEVKDYDLALSYYKQCYNLKPSNKSYLFNIVKTLVYINRELDEESHVDIPKELFSLIDTNKALVLKYLLDYGCLTEFDEIFDELTDLDSYDNDFLLLKARRLFYDKKYIEALGYFSLLEEQKSCNYEIAMYKTLIFMLTPPKLVTNYIKNLKISKIEREVLLSFNKIISGSKIKDFDDKSDIPKILDMIFNLLKELLLLKEFDIFQSALEILNYVISNMVLIRLAKLYSELGYNQLAAQEVYRSIHSFNIVDVDCINILRKSI